MRAWIITGLMWVGAIALVLTMLSLYRTPAQSEAPDPYALPSNPYSSAGSVRVFPWQDPDTGCKYLITISGRGAINTTLRMDRFGRASCAGTNQN